jgi:flagellum-specific ATP synthase
VREHLATYRDARDLVAIGAYVRGSSPRIDAAIDALDPINVFLRQGRDESSARAETFRRLAVLAGGKGS